MLPHILLNRANILNLYLLTKFTIRIVYFDVFFFQETTGCETREFSRMCSNMGYNKIRVPNSLGHKSVSAAELAMHEFFPLLKVGCSPQLQPFLCSIHFPQCHETELVLPCRSLCEQARSGCDSIMNRFGFKWPETLGCEKLPETGNCFYAGTCYRWFISCKRLS